VRIDTFGLFDSLYRLVGITRIGVSAWLFEMFPDVFRRVGNIPVMLRHSKHPCKTYLTLVSVLFEKEIGDYCRQTRVVFRFVDRLASNILLKRWGRFWEVVSESE